jgi:hypothetical protein
MDLRRSPFAWLMAVVLMFAVSAAGSAEESASQVFNNVAKAADASSHSLNPEDRTDG